MDICTMPKDEFDTKLFKAFPNLYGDHDKSPMETLLCFGTECGRGWNKIIWDLSEKLEILIIKYKEEHPNEEYYPKVMQIKEKFASLRVYMTSYSKEMDSLIDIAESLSVKTCECCGRSGKVFGDYWVSTSCLYHVVGKLTLTQKIFRIFRLNGLYMFLYHNFIKKIRTLYYNWRHNA